MSISFFSVCLFSLTYYHRLELDVGDHVGGPDEVVQVDLPEEERAVILDDLVA